MRKIDIQHTNISTARPVYVSLGLLAILEAAILVLFRVIAGN